MTVTDETLRTTIASSWRRSQIYGLQRESVPRLEPRDLPAQGQFVRAAAGPLAALQSDLDGLRATVVLADRHGQVLESRCSGRAFPHPLAAVIAPGVVLGEERIGTNAVGTTIETRTEVRVSGPDHFLTAFWGLACYGHPILHPITRRLEGVLDLSCGWHDDHPLLPGAIRRAVGDVQGELYRSSPLSQQHALVAFQAASRRRDRAVVVLGEGYVLATPAAVDLLLPDDHAVLRAYAREVGGRRARTCDVALASGRAARLTVSPIEDGRAVLVDLVALRTGQPQECPGEPGGWPLLIVGEPGSGRTTLALQVSGPEPATLDAADALRWGEHCWGRQVTAQLQRPQGVVIDNIELLSDALTAVVAKCLRTASCRVVLITTPGGHLAGAQASLAGLCGDRRDVVALRHRRHEIPALARHMLAEAAGTADVRLTSGALDVLAAQRWPANLSELRRVVEGLVRARSVGDITPADIPHSYRHPPAPDSPFKEAERDVILAAIAAAGGNKLRAAQTLGVSRSTLYNRIRALRMEC